MRPREKGPVIRASRRILCPRDFSPLAGAVLPHALRLAADSGADLVVLHVLPLAALTFLLIGLNFFSDAVRHAFDPRQINLGR